MQCSFEGMQGLVEFFFFGSHLDYHMRCHRFLYITRLSVDGFLLVILRIGWLRLLGSLKLYVSFAEYRLFYRALLQKRPINLHLDYHM